MFASLKLVMDYPFDPQTCGWLPGRKNLVSGQLEWTNGPTYIVLNQKDYHANVIYIHTKSPAAIVLITETNLDHYNKSIPNSTGQNLP